MSLSSLNLIPQLLKALKKRGYRSPSPIQKELIPAIFSKRDILAGAKTGTGKTAGFLLPILQELNYQYIDGKHYPKALIIAPSRELVKQIYANINSYGEYLELKSIPLYGGANISAQKNRLRDGVDIIVSTTGRFLEHLKDNNLSLKSIKYLVIDEADTLLDMGFIKELREILIKLPKKRQNILVSATLTGGVKRLSNQILHRAKLIEIDKMGSVSSNIKQVVYPVTKELKSELLSYIIGSKNYKQVLVFVRKKDEANEVYNELNLSGLKSAVIHGDRGVGARAKALSDFKEGKVRVLVATDIASRGLDIPKLLVVINYDIPHVISDYIHRVGRTGRAGERGVAITLISPKEEIALKSVERFIGREIKREIVEGYAPKERTQPKGARKTTDYKKRVDGAFGRKKSKKNKKRKTTKRDRFRD
jgi:ATP-dependent RNA helicase RhlE